MLNNRERTPMFLPDDSGENGLGNIQEEWKKEAMDKMPKLNETEVEEVRDSIRQDIRESQNHHLTDEFFKLEDLNNLDFLIWSKFKSFINFINSDLEKTDEEILKRKKEIKTDMEHDLSRFSNPFMYTTSSTLLRGYIMDVLFKLDVDYFMTK